MKNSFLTLVFTCFVLVSCAQNKKQITPKIHIAYNTSEKIAIDGNDSETSWKNVEWSDAFIDIQGVKKPKYETKIKILWDDTYFYILAKLEEPHVWATIKDRDAIIFYNNDFEVFVDPEGNNHGYYELEINALNTVWDLFISKPYRELNQPILNDWNVTGLKSAIKVNGTLNNPNDIDK
ncbi:MAG: carbohydrate-binding family 9-like protein, partial [Bacteroidota bacterium]